MPDDESQFEAAYREVYEAICKSNAGQTKYVISEDYLNAPWVELAERIRQEMYRIVMEKERERKELEERK